MTWPSFRAQEASRVNEEIGMVGRRAVAGRGAGHESQDAAIAIDPTSLA